ncbi:MAG: type II toxin-antitoxin system RelE/ParE family toxin [Pseudomonadales bacterium]|nr:type II toxin-antitoxin system RelE/ParE family toxin [Pseudomonadales bacterium]
MKVRWTAAAKQDRADIAGYIAIDNPWAALKMDEIFSEAAAKLEDFPKLGRIGKVPGTRELFPHPSYRLVYEVDEAMDTVWVMALVHTARQWPPVDEAAG